MTGSECDTKGKVDLKTSGDKPAVGEEYYWPKLFAAKHTQLLHLPSLCKLVLQARILAQFFPPKNTYQTMRTVRMNKRVREYFGACEYILTGCKPRGDAMLSTTGAWSDIQ